MAVQKIKSALDMATTASMPLCSYYSTKKKFNRSTGIAILCPPNLPNLIKL